MKLLSSTSAMLVFMATKANGFTVSSFSAKSSTSALRVNSYDEQLKSYYGALETEIADRPVTGRPSQTMPPPPPVPREYVTATPTQQPPQQANPLGISGVLFIGLPLWFLISFQLFFGPNKPFGTKPVDIPQVTAPTQIVVPPIVVPESFSKSAASPSGVVVLSQPITKAEVRGLFDLWNDALKTGDPATVAKRYGKEGVLLPTLSDVPRTDVNGIKDYFVGFLSKKPDGKILEGEIFVGNNWAQDAGIYEFTFEDGSKVKARYSFIYAYEDGQWMISHHHSSLMPQEVVRPTKITPTEVRSFFDVWNDALHTGKPYTVASLYSKDAVLLPTLSDKARYTTDEIADYFVGFLSKKPDGKILEGNVKIGPNWAQDAGIYEFTFEDGSKTRGRYSFVYTFENGEWKISNHHSSIMPEPAVAAFKKNAEMKKMISDLQVNVASKNAEMKALQVPTVYQNTEGKTGTDDIKTVVQRKTDRDQELGELDQEIRELLRQVGETDGSTAVILDKESRELLRQIAKTDESKAIVNQKVAVKTDQDIKELLGNLL